MVVGVALTEGVASQAFSVQEIVRSAPQTQVLHLSAAKNDSPLLYFLSLTSQTASTEAAVGVVSTLGTVVGSAKAKS